MNTENESDIDAYELAMLAAQLVCRRHSPTGAVDAAWTLWETAKDHLEGIELRAQLDTPGARAGWEKQQTERLESLKIPFGKGIKAITSQNRLDYALKWFKKFLAAKAGRDRRPSEREAWVEAKLIQYRNQGFTGTEAKKFKEEFEQWHGKGKQGCVLKPASDGRLRENRQKKLEAKGKEAFSELTKPKPEFTKHYEIAVMKGARGGRAIC